MIAANVFRCASVLNLSSDAVAALLRLIVLVSAYYTNQLPKAAAAVGNIGCYILACSPRRGEAVAILNLWLARDVLNDAHTLYGTLHPSPASTVLSDGITLSTASVGQSS